MEQAKPSMEIKHIVIVGGGTAGWLAANHLAKVLKPNHPQGIKITLVESPDIPNIGVGEGTVPNMRNTLQYLGISETEFVQQCDVTFKQSIKFVDWLHNPGADVLNEYHHIFNYPGMSANELLPYWLQGVAGEATPYAEAVSIQAQLCDAGLAPKQITDPEFIGSSNYAYHLDAAKFSMILKRNAEAMGVCYQQANLTNVVLNDEGEISAIDTDRLGQISADFFVDCTGFSSLLLGKALGVGFVDKSDVLFVDNALAIQVPYEQADAPIPGFTIATAKEAGWIWDIGLSARRGIGYVYSSRYTDRQQAEDTLRQYIGSASEGIECRNISMSIGHREKFWHKNCVAIGLSQGFVEPLEATGLIVFDATSRMLAELFPSDKSSMAPVAEKYNKQVHYSWNSVIDFVKLHYCLTQRNDTQFWRDNASPTSIPDSLQQKLVHWRTHLPSEYDFPSKFDIFNLDNYLYVLYGMQFPTDVSHMANRYAEPERAKDYFEKMKSFATQAKSVLPTNRQIIEQIKAYGLQKC